MELRGRADPGVWEPACGPGASCGFYVPTVTCGREGTSSTTTRRIKTAVLHLASRFEDFVNTKVAVTTAILLAGGLTAQQALSGSL